MQLFYLYYAVESFIELTPLLKRDKFWKAIVRNEFGKKMSPKITHIEKNFSKSYFKKVRMEKTSFKITACCILGLILLEELLKLIEILLKTVE